MKFFDSIKANLTYCVDTGVKPVNETMAEKNPVPNYSGKSKKHLVTLHNGRLIQDEFVLDDHGFKFIVHPTKVSDFYDQDELKKIYYPEIEQLIKDTCGASRVVVFDHTIRVGNKNKRARNQLREPVRRVHNDYTEWSGPQRVRDILPGEAEKLLNNRFAIIQVWRPICDLIEADPLAICEASSLAPKDLIISERRYPERKGETYQVAYNPNHRWYYFPLMARAEAIIFKVYESEKDGRARFTAHTSFVDPNTLSSARPRESIEIRTLAFFEP